MIRTVRSGGIVLFALGLAVFAVVLVYHPGTAEIVVPSTLLERHPMFEAQETGRDCNMIEENAETADEVAKMFDINVEISDGKYRTACLDQCGNNQEMTKFYCRDNELICVCRRFNEE